MYPFEDASFLTRFVIGLDEALREYRGPNQDPFSRAVAPANDPWREDLFRVPGSIPSPSGPPDNDYPTADQLDTQPAGQGNRVSRVERRSVKPWPAAPSTAPGMGAAFMALAGVFAARRFSSGKLWRQGRAPLLRG
jgi:hypothetical protein